MTRAYNPDLWKTLEQLGLGKLVVQAGRERELANIYRANDAARRLGDEEFARVLEFTRQAIDMAVELDTYREFLAILSREIEKLRQQIDG